MNIPIHTFYSFLTTKALKGNHKGTQSKTLCPFVKILRVPLWLFFHKYEQMDIYWDIRVEN